MITSREPRGLEIDENPNFVRKEWRFQRVGVAALFLFVAAALLGFTGKGGPMSRGEAGDPGGSVRVEYERFVRRGGASQMKVHVRAAPGDVRFWVGAPYFERVRIESVAPTPERVSVETGRHVYLIRAGSRDVTVTLEVDHTSLGRLEAEVGLVDGPSVRFSQMALF